MFRFPNTPWNAGHVVDFQTGVDKIDLRGLYAASGYGGANPMGDGYVKLEADGLGGTKVLYDTDRPASGNTIQFLITTLDNMQPNALANTGWLL